MATYRGAEGYVAFGGGSPVTIGEISSWELTINNDALETSIMGTLWRTYRTGLSGGTGRLQGFVDYGDVAGQKVIFDALVQADPDGLIANLQLHIDATKYFTGPAILENFQISDAVAALATFTANYRLNGEPSISWS